MRLHYLQHVPFEDLGFVAGWARARGVTVSGTALFAGEEPPSADAYDGLVVLGGPMGVHDGDAFPWLEPERACIRAALSAERPVLGLCLGAQLLAHVLGAAVTKNPQREIGWFPVQLTDAGRGHPLLPDFPAEFTAFHWHGDTFAIPDGAVWLASSAACPHQAFAWGDRALGLQFHLEYTPEGVERMLTHCADELVDAPWVQSAADVRAGLGTIQAAHERMRGVLDALFFGGAA